MKPRRALPGIQRRIFLGRRRWDGLPQFIGLVLAAMGVLALVVAVLQWSGR